MWMYNKIFDIDISSAKIHHEKAAANKGALTSHGRGLNADAHHIAHTSFSDKVSYKHHANRYV
jgi:hypothetical protein